VEAISCYAKARDLVKEDTGEPFLQGSLQLARALNQRLFAERDLELFYQARDVLSSLNNFEMYDARVNYLQSIAHRIAGEITAGNTGTRLGDSENYFQLALEYARKAQEDRPDHTDSYLAEAHCLEMMGDLDGAIVARTQAVTVARTEAVTAAGIDKQRLLEALHFRWRLYYWTGQYAAALDDIYELQAGLEGTPLHLIYAHVYPAWVLAEMGDDGGAVELAQSIVPDSSDAPVAARRIIWAATTLRLIGHADLADELIAACDSRVSFDAELLPWQTPEWMQTLYEMVGGAEDLEALLELIDKARAAGMAQPWRLSGEAYFHDAVIRLADGRRNEALDGFATAHRSFDSIQSYMFHAQIIKKRMSDNPQWPLWLPADALEFDDPSRVQRR
jgi:tetratricopeptide (TPR) repeat protein